MAITALPVINKISITSTKNILTNDISASYQEYYEQIISHGYNNSKDIWGINWIGLTKAEKITIETLIDSLGSWGTYSYTPCYETISKNFRMVKDSFSIQTVHTNCFNISAKFIQIFDLNIT